MMRKVLCLLAAMLLIGVVWATPVNFTDWQAYGDAWKANNDTHTIVMWNATGGHTWLATGNATSVEYWVIAGGGGGGGAFNGRGGGGGAGGLLYGNVSISGTVNLTVGAGGAGGNQNVAIAKMGANSSFANVTGGDGINSKGGGIGGGDTFGVNGGSGGSGGGGGATTGSAGTGGNGIAPQGNNGGNGVVNYGSGGGGGSGAVGGNAPSGTSGGNGGTGILVYANGTTGICYAGGGGGGSTTTQGVGACGGGNGNGVSAVNETGSGGGGAGAAGIGGNGGSGVVIISYLTPSGVVPIVAAFTASANPSTVNTTVSFTDASTGTPTTWNWTIDGSITNTTQNAAYAFSTVGTHSVDLNVTNSTGHFSNITHNQVVVSPSGFTQQDLWQTGHYTKTLHITDSSSNAPIPVVVVTDDNGQSYTTTNGTAYFTEDAGAVVFYFAATDYVSKSMSYIIDGDSTDTVQMVASSGSPQQNTWYTPWQVRIRIVDYYGAPLPNINVTANYVASTLPSTNTSWLVSAFGINSGVADDMLNSGVAMAGATDDNGGLSFTMFKSLQYRLTITNTTLSVASTKTLYPSDQEYVIYVRTAGQTAANNTLAMRNGTLPWYSVNSTHINLNMTYVDTSLCTSQLVFRVWFRDNGTEVHNTTWSGFGSGYVYDNHTVPKAPIGTEYLWGYNATTVC